MHTYITEFETIKQRVGVLSQHMRFDTYVATTGRTLALPITEVVALAIWKHMNGIPTKKAVWKTFQPPCSYKTLVVSMNRWSVLALQCVALILHHNRATAHTIKHVDSTELPVCKFKNAHFHKTMKGVARFGHTSQGTFFGLKLHLISDLNRTVLSVMITPGDTDDRSVVERLSHGLTGIFIADAGYVSMHLEQRFRQLPNRMILIQPRKNMKKLMTAFQHLLMSTRMLVELNFRTLKLFRGLLTSLPRSVDGYLANYTYSLLSYLIA